MIEHAARSSREQSRKRELMLLYLTNIPRSKGRSVQVLSEEAPTRVGTMYVEWGKESCSLFNGFTSSPKFAVIHEGDPAYTPPDSIPNTSDIVVISLPPGVISMTCQGDPMEGVRIVSRRTPDYVY